MARPSAESVLAVSVEPLSKGFLRATLGWIIGAIATMGLEWLPEPSAALRVRRRSDNQIVYEESYRGQYNVALMAQETFEADLQRMSLQEFLDKYGIPASTIASR